MAKRDGRLVAVWCSNRLVDIAIASGNQDVKVATPLPIVGGSGLTDWATVVDAFENGLRDWVRASVGGVDRRSSFVVEVEGLASFGIVTALSTLLCVIAGSRKNGIAHARFVCQLSVLCQRSVSVTHYP